MDLYGAFSTDKHKFRKKKKKFNQFNFTSYILGYKDTAIFIMKYKKTKRLNFYLNHLVRLRHLKHEVSAFVTQDTVKDAAGNTKVLKTNRVLGAKTIVSYV